MSVGIAGRRNSDIDALAALANRNHRWRGVAQMVVVEIPRCENDAGIHGQWILCAGHVKAFTTGKGSVAICVQPHINGGAAHNHPNGGQLGHGFLLGRKKGRGQKITARLQLEDCLGNQAGGGDRGYYTDDNHHRNQLNQGKSFGKSSSADCAFANSLLLSHTLPNVIINVTVDYGSVPPAEPIITNSASSPPTPINVQVTAA